MYFTDKYGFHASSIWKHWMSLKYLFCKTKTFYEKTLRKMTKCAVKTCTSYSGGTNNISFHMFPIDPKRKREWVNAIHRDESWIPRKHSVICSLHFQSTCFNFNAKKQRKLEKDAIPTLNLPIYQLISLSENNNNTEHVHDQGTATGSNVRDQETPIGSKEQECLIFNTQGKLKLRNKINVQSKRIKRLQYSNRCLKMKVAKLQDILDSITQKNLITDDDKILIEKLRGK